MQMRACVCVYCSERTGELGTEYKRAKEEERGEDVKWRTLILRE